MAECRSCKAEIHWGETENGKKVPLDMKPKNVYVLLNPDKETYQLVRGYESHFSTCPQSKQWRKNEI